MLVYVRGAGDIATGIALRLHRVGCQVVMADIAEPTCIRRTVAFSEAIRLGEARVEDVTARLAADARVARAIAAAGDVAVVVDPDARMIGALAPDAVVDAILAKRNLGTSMDMAPVVVGVGPGFTAGIDCHAAVETKRGHYLGRAIYQGSPIANTGVPGVIAGVGADRVLRAPADGPFECVRAIGDAVSAGEVVGRVAGEPMVATIDGVLRGLIASGVRVVRGMKSGDIDPRGERAFCDTVSDKASAVGGGVLEAIMHFSSPFKPLIVLETRLAYGLEYVMASDVKLTKLADCAGCGAKVGAGQLAKLFEGFEQPHDPNLLVGFDRADDAAVYKVAPDVAMVQTLDFFPPIADDPFTFGTIAATNALSDIYAMGGEPKTALNIMAVPQDMDPDAVRDILRGGCAKATEAGAIVCGGHSIYDPEPKYGMAVTGLVHPDRILTNAGARPGDVLVYTKPLGIGVLTSAMKADLVDEDLAQRVLDIITTLNRGARDIMVRYRVHACTDITGFGVMGHLLEMAQGAGVAIDVDAAAFEFLPRAREFAAMGIVPAGAYRNREYAQASADLSGVPLDVADLLFDPQTSGGLMICVDAEDAPAMLAELAADPRVPVAVEVGRVLPYDDAGDDDDAPDGAGPAPRLRVHW